MSLCHRKSWQHRGTMQACSRRDIFATFFSAGAAVALTRVAGDPARAEPPAASIPRASAIAELVAARYSGSTIRHAELYHVSINQVYRLECADGLRWLRLSLAHDNTPARAEAEQEAITRLAEAGARVVRPLLGDNGKFVQIFSAVEGERVAVLYRDVAGQADAPMNPRRSRRLGREMARMHAVADAIGVRGPWAVDLRSLFVEPIEMARAEARDQGAGLDWLEHIAARSYELCKDLLGRGVADHGFCHGDLHFGNVIWDRAEEPTLIDFDWCFDGPRALDLGVHLFSHGLRSEWPEEQRGARDECWQGFLAGYREEREFREVDCQAAHVLLIGHLLGYLSYCVAWKELIGTAVLSDRRLRDFAWYLRAWIQELKIPVELPAMDACAVSEHRLQPRRGRFGMY